jgi:hypothetical protein
MTILHVPGRNHVTDVPPKAFPDIFDAYVEMSACGRRRHIYQLGDLFCVARTPLQAMEAYFKAKRIDPTRAMTAPQIRKLMSEARPEE